MRFSSSLPELLSPDELAAFVVETNPDNVVCWAHVQFYIFAIRIARLKQAEHEIDGCEDWPLSDYAQQAALSGIDYQIEKWRRGQDVLWRQAVEARKVPGNCYGFLQPNIEMLPEKAEALMMGNFGADWVGCKKWMVEGCPVDEDHFDRVVQNAES
jgi:hypothetical protein